MADADRLLLADALKNAGPRTRPLIRRSAAVQQALDDLRTSQAPINSAPAAIMDVLANALLKVRQDKVNKKLDAAELDDSNQRATALIRQLPGGAPAKIETAPLPPVQPAPTPAAPTPMAPQPAAMPAPQQPLAAPAPTPARAPGILGQPVTQQAREMVESGGNPNAVSPMGARGPAQIMPRTGADPGFGVQPLRDQSPQENSRLGNDYMEAMTKRYGNQVYALVANNWGPGRADEWVKRGAKFSDLPQETQLYLGKIAVEAARNGPPGSPQPQAAPQAPMQPPAPQAAPAAQPAPPMPVPQQEAPPTSIGDAAFSPELQAYVRQLVASGNPQDLAQAQKLVMEAKAKSLERPKYEVQTSNGVPVWNDPYTPGRSFAGQVPDAAMTKDAPPPQGMTPGTVGQREPTGGYKVLQQPPAGYQGTPQQQQFVRGGPQDPAAGMNLVQGEDKLRTEYRKDIQPFVEARNGYQKVIAAAKDGTGASDIALIFGFMKTLDPGSTVREGEYATVQNSGSISQTVQNAYNKALSGQKLQPEQRAQFANTAAQQFQIYQQQADQLNQRYGGMAKSYGYDPSRVVQQFQPVASPYKPPADPAPAQNARKAPDGKWYVPDPKRPGKYLMVQP